MVDAQRLAELTEFLDGVGKWADEYCFDNSDYADEYMTMACEDQIRWQPRIIEWMSGEKYGHLPKEVAIKVWEVIDARWDCEAETDRSEMGRYQGKGCCIGSWAMGEYHDQLDPARMDELSDLHESGELDHYLDEYRGDLCISRSRRRVWDDDNSSYVAEGRQTYKPNNLPNPTLDVITSLGGQVRIVIPEERMHEIVTQTVTTILREGL